MTCLMERAAPDVAASLAPPLRIMSVSHSATRAGAGRLRYEQLAADPDFDLTLVVPKVWHEFGQSRAEHGEASLTRLKVEVSPARLTRGGPAKWYLHHYPRMSKLMRSVRPDVIHLWEEPWSLVALQAARLRAKLFPRASLVLETDQNVYRRLPAGFERIRQYTLARTDLLIVRSQAALAVSREAGYRGAHQIVEYGINPTHFHPRETVPDPREEERPFRIGYIGRLVPEKGLIDVMDALARCKHRVEFHLLGEGPDAERLVARATDLGLSDRVRLLPSCDAAGVAEFMRSQDAVVLMSRTTRTWKEQFGRVIMEAHACGVPVIGSTSGSIPDVIGDGGWIVPEGQSRALADLLDRLADAPAEVARAGAVGLASAQKRFSFDTVSADLRRAWLLAAASRPRVTADAQPE